jgi:hypothetical protein
MIEERLRVNIVPLTQYEYYSRGLSHQHPLGGWRQVFPSHGRAQCLPLGRRKVRENEQLVAGLRQAGDDRRTGGKRLSTLSSPGFLSLSRALERSAEGRRAIRHRIYETQHLDLLQESADHSGRHSRETHCRLSRPAPLDTPAEEGGCSA